MIFTQDFFIRIILVIKLSCPIGVKTTTVSDLMDWTVVEQLAEEYPYVVGLLNATKEYVCTGIIVDKRTVLTAGSCLSPILRYIAIGSAVISKSINQKNLFEIAGTTLHGDYIFEMKATDPNITFTHSNIGLVFSVRPELESYIPGADLGNYYASELQQKALNVVGFGMINDTNMAVLQQQKYHQSPCTNPKWYYCICGIEFSAHSKTYKEVFGEGAPVFFGSEVVGLTAAPCGTLELKTMNVPYNIFTVIGPYLPWIDKRNSNFTFHLRTKSGAGQQTTRHSGYVLLVIFQVNFIIIY